MTKDDPYIQFLPFQNQSQMPILYRVGDVFCLPSRGPGETWGLAVNEALACGRPVVVSTRAGGATDLVQTRDVGIVLKNPNDQDELVNALQDVAVLQVKNSEIRRKCGEHIQSWSYQAICEAIERNLK